MTNSENLTNLEKTASQSASYEMMQKRKLIISKNKHLADTNYNFVASATKSQIIFKSSKLVRLTKSNTKNGYEHEYQKLAQKTELGANTVETKLSNQDWVT